MGSSSSNKLLLSEKQAGIRLACDMLDCKRHTDLPEDLRFPTLLVACLKSGRRNGLGKRLKPIGEKVRMECQVQICKACRENLGGVKLAGLLFSEVFMPEAKRRGWRVIERERGKQEFVLAWGNPLDTPMIPAPPADMSLEIQVGNAPVIKQDARVAPDSSEAAKLMQDREKNMPESETRELLGKLRSTREQA